jgi:O-antigen/teichoic acid export membrane protein
VPGAIQGAALLLVSTLAEGAWLAWRCRDNGEAGDGDDENWNPGWVGMSRFFLPLVLTTWVMAFSRTIINAGLARAADPAVSLAAFSVACNVVFTFESPVVVIRNTALAFADNQEALRRMPRFTLAVGAAMSVAVGLLAATPAVDFTLVRLIGVTPAIHRAALAPIAIMAVSLLILGWRQLCYALLMGAQRTVVIGVSALARLLFLAAGLFLGPRLWPALPGAASAAIVYTLGFLLETAITHVAGYPLVGRRDTAAAAR